MFVFVCVGVFAVVYLLVFVVSFLSRSLLGSFFEHQAGVAGNIQYIQRPLPLAISGRAQSGVSTDFASKR